MKTRSTLMFPYAKSIVQTNSEPIGSCITCYGKCSPEQGHPSFENEGQSLKGVKDMSVQRTT